MLFKENEMLFGDVKQDKEKQTFTTVLPCWRRSWG